MAAAMMYWSDRDPEQFDQGYRVPSRDELREVTAKAVSWLAQALERNDGDTREIAAELAEVHGMMHASVDDKIKFVRLANEGAMILRRVRRV